MASALDAIVDAPPTSPDRWRGTSTVIMVCLLLAAACLWVVAGANTQILFALFATVAAASVISGAMFCWKHESWLPFALILLILSLYTLPNPGLRAAVHYSIVTLLCLPLAPRLLRSGLLRQGGFRLYTFYYFWAAFTVSYSLAPLFSLSRLADSLLLFCAIAWCASQVNTEEQAFQLLWRAMLGAGLITLLLVVFGLFGPHSLNWLSPEESIQPSVLRDMRLHGLQVGGIERFRGILSGPNDVGLVMLLTVGPALVCWSAVSQRMKFNLGGLIVAALGACAAADSRSPILGLTLGGLLYSVWRYRAKSLPLIGAGTLVVVAVATLMGHKFGTYVDRGDITTLTGRTEMWQFVLAAVARHPIRGYGYEVQGAILNSRYFPLWWGPWDQGPHSSLHDGYLNHAAGVGIPATVFWLFMMLRPWFFIFRQPGDPWRLKSMFFLITLPLMVLNLTEAAIGDCIEASGFLFALVWALAERYRLLTLQSEAETARRTLDRMSRPLASLLQ
ncbi:MAG TPA: O-antigen ligase family protein [Candidatus Binataceae bacterium]|nr:O-antigen ligase family protein [Candidatus Binataceae bacterium]